MRSDSPLHEGEMSALKADTGVLICRRQGDKIYNDLNNNKNKNRKPMIRIESLIIFSIGKI